MKSSIITNDNFLCNKERYSDFRVLLSKSGWYVGTVYTCSDGFKEPATRDSDFFASEIEAIEALNALTTIGENTSYFAPRRKAKA